MDSEARLVIARIELARFVAEIHEDSPRFEHALAVVAIGDRGDLSVGRYLEKIGGELLVVADVDRVNRVAKLELLERYRNLASVGRAPGKKIDGHRRTR